jgi:tight adherence protein C
MDMSIELALIVTLIAIGAGIKATSFFFRQRNLNRVAMMLETDEGEVPSPGRPQGRLSRWLYLAGFRSPETTALFYGVNVLTITTGGIVALMLYQSPSLLEMRRNVQGIPGLVGEALDVVLAASPFLIVAILGSIPTTFVRSSRRRRVLHIEQDLPMTLELLATLAEAGLSFDAALQRILESQSRERPLAREFRHFQLELVAGVPRIQSLRHLAQRIEVISVTIFVSALIQAEHVGASLSETLRRQADDVRDRRREHALLQAQGLSVKLVFPLVICFLPGIFVSTLGPTLFQLIQVADSVIRGGR